MTATSFTKNTFNMKAAFITTDALLKKLLLTNNHMSYPDIVISSF